MSRKKIDSTEFADNLNDERLPRDRTVGNINQKAYETPILVCYGDVRDITLGPTAGIGESGNELARRNPP